MMSQLRWALLILGVVFLVALALWERRRPRQASGALARPARREGGSESPARMVREPPLTLPEVRVREPPSAAALPIVEAPADGANGANGAEARAAATAAASHADADLADVHHADVDHGHADRADTDQAGADNTDASSARDGPDDGPDVEDETGERLTITVAPLTAPHAASPDSGEIVHGDAGTAAAAPRETLPELPPLAPLVVDWPAEHERRILALRLVAPQRERFAGRSLRQALAAEGFLLGQFAIFHKPDDERRAVLSAASLTRPGTFDMETMDSQHYGGLSLFAVLPGPKPAPQAFDELVFAARNLNERLHGVLQDEHGTPLTPARIAHLRDQLRVGARS